MILNFDPNRPPAMVPVKQEPIFLTLMEMLEVANLLQELARRKPVTFRALKIFVERELEKLDDDEEGGE